MQNAFCINFFPLKKAAGRAPGPRPALRAGLRHSVGVNFHIPYENARGPGEAGRPALRAGSPTVTENGTFSACGHARLRIEAKLTVGDLELDARGAPSTTKRAPRPRERGPTRSCEARARFASLRGAKARKASSVGQSPARRRSAAVAATAPRVRGRCALKMFHFQSLRIETK